ncbi:ovochymase-2-like [Sabethes cyaneus]|uniref:ovochymase-2-like n=1 Tax=Sabethes cyaneus TaxID=53552 RepID=UPI00237EDF1B|nr:ovochymase-2-like [Sabethes cyaneus]
MWFQLFTLTAFIQIITAAPTNDGQRVINGTDTTIEEHPFMLSLRDSLGTHNCGGTILTRYWIMTAAHCVGSSTPSLQSIQVGRTTVSMEDDESVFQIELVIVHPEYDPWNSSVNDIALLKLVKPLEFSESIQPVTLPKPYFEVDEADLGVTLVGWGMIDIGVFPDTLQKVDYYVVPNDECNIAHESNTIYPSQICAAEPGGGKGQCSGDSGGPLLHHGVQVGIVSWSVKPCTIAPYPGVLTKVSHYIDFIYEHTDVEPPTDPPKEECNKTPLQETGKATQDSIDEGAQRTSPRADRLKTFIQFGTTFEETLRSPRRNSSVSTIRLRRCDISRNFVSINMKFYEISHCLKSDPLVNELATLKLPNQAMPYGKIPDRYSCLKDSPVMSYALEVPRMIIGLDSLHVFAPLETRMGRPGQPIAGDQFETGLLWREDVRPGSYMIGDTKRIALGYVMAMFDPQSLLSPFTTVSAVCWC